jgi:enamine deaminase RidA (YjgF/YER057c/UK114 family)
MPRENYNVFDEMYKRKNFTWSDAVKKGKILVLSGTVATDENHRTIHKGDLEAQVRYIYETVKGLLAKAGASFDDVVDHRLRYAPAVPDYVKTADIRREYMKGNYRGNGVVVQPQTRLVDRD